VLTSPLAPLQPARCSKSIIQLAGEGSMGERGRSPLSNSPPLQTNNKNYFINLRFGEGVGDEVNPDKIPFLFSHNPYILTNNQLKTINLRLLSLTNLHNSKNE
jgi:hypothetical protein